MTEQKTDSPWYKDGLRFQCTGCGKCCTGSPGYVFVTEEEIERLALLLSISVDQFIRKYTRKRYNRYCLTEKKAPNKPCIFLKDNKCEVYQERPKQCRTFPWWQENLNSKESWQLAAIECEGINDQAPLVPYSQIVQLS